MFLGGIRWSAYNYTNKNIKQFVPFMYFYSSLMLNGLDTNSISSRRCALPLPGPHQTEDKRDICHRPFPVKIIFTQPIQISVSGAKRNQRSSTRTYIRPAEPTEEPQQEKPSLPRNAPRHPATKHPISNLFLISIPTLNITTASKPQWMEIDHKTREVMSFPRKRESILQTDARYRLKPSLIIFNSISFYATRDILKRSTAIMNTYLLA